MSEKPSTIVQENINALIERERAGRIEHGGDLDRQDLPVMRWLEELRCESLDSANYAAKLMHLLPKLLAAVAVLERIGFTWDGDEWKSGAAQEAVAWQVGDDFYTSESLAIEAIQQWGPSGAIAIPLYAAPVVAAPVADARLANWVIAAVGDIPYNTMTCDQVIAALEANRRVYEGNEGCGTHYRASTPATPGIDLEQFREAVGHMIDCAETDAELSQARRLLALIDASPKGGSDAPDMFWNDADPERAFDSIIELVSQEWSNGSVVEGDVMEIQQAIRLPNIKVRVVESEDDGVDYEQLQATSADHESERDFLLSALGRVQETTKDSHPVAYGIAEHAIECLRRGAP